MSAPSTAPEAATPLDHDDELACLVALHQLRGMGPLRLDALLAGRSARRAWDELRAGRTPPTLRPLGVGARLAREWSGSARDVRPAELLGRYRHAGVDVVPTADPRYPPRLAAVAGAPVLLFSRGDPSAAHVPLVAIVGTRRATPYGLRAARRLGRELGEAGVAVVSGLAAGIDAAAHLGALEVAAAAPVGIVGSGLDVVYPRRNRALWGDVARHGALLSEAPLGARPERWRFPARNRIVAALASVVVVVESHASGGSLLTAELAAVLDRPVLAVPGSIFSPASAGTNGLISSGATPARDTGDVLVALGLAQAHGASPDHGASPARADPAAEGLGVDEGRVLEALGFEPVHLDELALRSGLGLGRLAAAVDALERSGHIAHERGVVHRAR